MSEHAVAVGTPAEGVWCPRCSTTDQPDQRTVTLAEDGWRLCEPCVVAALDPGLLAVLDALGTLDQALRALGDTPAVRLANEARALVAAGSQAILAAYDQRHAIGQTMQW
jgi:hypothetical protein